MSAIQKFVEKHERFTAFDNAHPDVWTAFEHLALQAMAKNKTRLSAWLIVNLIRWQRIMEFDLPDLHVSNDYIAFYARKFMAADPKSRGGFFVLKRMDGENYVATKKLCGCK